MRERGYGELGDALVHRGRGGTSDLRRRIGGVPHIWHCRMNETGATDAGVALAVVLADAGVLASREGALGTVVLLECTKRSLVSSIRATIKAQNVLARAGMRIHVSPLPCRNLILAR